jgi:hypothetical protein
VYIGLSGEDVNKCFEGINGEELNFDFNGYNGMEFGEIKEKAIGMEHGGEASAYLLGWLASCINKARLGIGDFIEIKDKEK